MAPLNHLLLEPNYPRVILIYYIFIDYNCLFLVINCRYLFKYVTILVNLVFEGG